MDARRFTRAGLREVTARLEELLHLSDAELEAFLADRAFTEPVRPIVSVDLAGVKRRFELAERLWQQLGPPAGVGQLEHDSGLWTWLAVAHRRLWGPLAPNRGVGEPARWIADGSFQRRGTRHVVLGCIVPYAIHADDPARALAMLAGPVGRTSKLAEQLGSRRELLLSPAAMQVATWLYVDPVFGTYVDGVMSSGPGGVMRFAAVMMQFDLVWDLQTVSADQLWELLPAEFDERKAAAR